MDNIQKAIETALKDSLPPVAFMPELNTEMDLRLHYVVIRVIDHNRNLVFFRKWDKLRWDLRKKYDWYFKFIAAKTQVKYPKLDVALYWGNIELNLSEEQLAKIKFSNKIKRKKASITEVTNKLKSFQNSWINDNLLFPMEDDHNYKALLNKINNLTEELRLLEKSLEVGAITV